MSPIYLAVLLTFPVVNWHTQNGLEEIIAKRSYESDRVDGYCGLYCCHVAFRSLGKNIEFSELLSSRYLSGRSGSSAANLVTLIEDRGCNASVFKGLTIPALLAGKQDVILHSKGSDDDYGDNRSVWAHPVVGATSVGLDCDK